MLRKNISFVHWLAGPKQQEKAQTILLAAALLAERLSVGLRSECSAHVAQRRRCCRAIEAIALGKHFYRICGANNTIGAGENVIGLLWFGDSGVAFCL
jgi:hypothetical protein